LKFCDLTSAAAINKALINSPVAIAAQNAMPQYTFCFLATAQINNVNARFSNTPGSVIAASGWFSNLAIDSSHQIQPGPHIHQWPTSIHPESGAV